MNGRARSSVAWGMRFFWYRLDYKRENEKKTLVPYIESSKLVDDLDFPVLAIGVSSRSDIKESRSKAAKEKTNYQYFE